MSPDFPAGGIIRETALDQIPKGAARAIRFYLREFFGGYAENGAVNVEMFAGSISKADLLAVAKDLRHTAAYLALVAFETLDDAKKDERLVRLADWLAVHLEKIADFVESGVRGKRRRKGG
jgi:hypothetical protein